MSCRRFDDDVIFKVSSSKLTLKHVMCVCLQNECLEIYINIMSCHMIYHMWFHKKKKEKKNKVEKSNK